MEMMFNGTVQGGFMFLETTALETFIRCFAAYQYYLSNILSTVQLFNGNFERTEHDVDMAGLNDQCVEGYVQETPDAPPQAKREHMEAFTLYVSQFSIALLIEDEKGNICLMFLMLLLVSFLCYFNFLG